MEPLPTTVEQTEGHATITQFPDAGQRPPGSQFAPELAEDTPAERPGQNRIRWTLEESRSVAAELAKEVRKNGWRHLPEVGDRVGRAMLLEMLAAAQVKALGRDRRRLGASLQSFNVIFWKLVEDALAAKTSLDAPSRNVSTPEAQAAVKPETAPPENAATEAMTPKVEAQSGFALARADDPLSSVPTGTLLSALFTRLMSSMTAIGDLREMNGMLTDDVGKLQLDNEALKRRMAEVETQLELSGKKDVKRPRVAILGCRRYEFEHIRQGCDQLGLRLDLRHYDQDTAPGNVHADWAISLKWLNHAWDAKIKEAVPSEHYRFLNGGIGTAIKQLQAWFQPAA
jgi:regulator of replication initiation timing